MEDFSIQQLTGRAPGQWPHLSTLIYHLRGSMDIIHIDVYRYPTKCSWPFERNDPPPPKKKTGENKNSTPAVVLRNFPPRSIVKRKWPIFIFWSLGNVEIPHEFPCDFLRILGFWKRSSFSRSSLAPLLIGCVCTSPEIGTVCITCNHQSQLRHGREPATKDDPMVLRLKHYLLICGST